MLIANVAVVAVVEPVMTADVTVLIVVEFVLIGNVAVVAVVEPVMTADVTVLIVV